MRFSKFTSTTLPLVSLCALSQAWPLFNHAKRSPEPAPLPLPQSYSVVAVDGGSTANGAQPATRTVTNVEIQTQIQTLVSTITVGGSEQATTIITTILVPTTVVQNVPVTITAETTVAETTTMVVEPLVTSTPYDDGKWHTTYYQRSTMTDVLVPVSAPAPSAPVPSSAAPWVAMDRPSSVTHVSEFVAPTPASSAPASTSTNWATAYGSWRDAPENGSWWGKGDN